MRAAVFFELKERAMVRAEILHLVVRPFPTVNGLRIRIQQCGPLLRRNYPLWACPPNTKFGVTNLDPQVRNSELEKRVQTGAHALFGEFLCRIAPQIFSLPSCATVTGKKTHTTQHTSPNPYS
eukprot:scaffold24369_cov216-Skeletonema_marinoi.AAC.10